MSSMTGWHIENFETLAHKFDFSKYSTVADIGGAEGALAC
jgi:hypothetical protein